MKFRKSMLHDASSVTFHVALPIILIPHADGSESWCAQVVP